MHGMTTNGFVINIAAGSCGATLGHDAELLDGWYW